MFSETPEEMQSEATGGWAGRPRQERPHSYTHRETQTRRPQQRWRWRDKDGGELHILNANDLFQGGVCKEYTVLMWQGCNAVTSCLPA